MSAYASSQLPVVLDSTLVSDMGVTRGRPSGGPATAGGAGSMRRARLAQNIDLVDLEPHWLAAVDAATD